MGGYHVHWKAPPSRTLKPYLWCLFLSAAITSLAEGILGRFWANSVFAQADAMDAFVHSLWYGSPLFMSWMFMRWIRSARFRNKMLSFQNLVNCCVFFGSLLWLLIQAVQRLFYYQPVADSFFMLISGSVGLSGGIFAAVVLWELKNLPSLPRDITASFRMDYFWLHTLLDLSISGFVVLDALGQIIAPRVLLLAPYAFVFHYMDPVFTIVAVLLVGRIGYKFFRV